MRDKSWLRTVTDFLKKFPGIDTLLKCLIQCLRLSQTAQIRSRDEAKQTIELRTYCLSTVDFGPSEAAKATPIAKAEEQINKYLVRLKNRRQQSQRVP